MAQETNISVEVSDNGSTGWTELVLLPAGTTSYQHTGLAASTTKYYRVKAKGDGTTTSDSLYTSVQSATTDAAASVYEQESDTLFINMATQPSSERKGVIDTYIKTLKDAGVWAKLDRLFVFAAHTNSGGEALINWVNPANVAALAGTTPPPFTADRGFTANGTGYINSNFTPSANGVKFLQNTASLAFYQRVTGVRLGGIGGTRVEMLGATGTTHSLNINNSADVKAPNWTQAVGFRLGVRETSTQMYQFENSTSTALPSTTSGSPCTQPVFVLARNNSGNADNIASSASGSQVSMVAFGGFLTQAERVFFQDATQNYMIAIGANV
jgi:hypothetical protein